MIIQAISTNPTRRASKASLSPAYKAASIAPQVTFGYKPAELSDRQRWNKTKLEALELFQQFPDSEGLIQATQKLVEKAHQNGETPIKGLEVYDGSQPGMAWVNEVCQQEGSIFTHVPPSVRWNLSKHVSPDLLDLITQDMPETPNNSNKISEVIFDKLLNNKKIGIFLSPKYVNHPWALKHEIIHVLQNKNGLQAGSPDPICDTIAQNHRDQFQKYPVKNQLVQGVWRLFRVADTYIFSLPIALVMGTVTGRVFKAIRKRNEETPGKALRRYAEREMEVDKLFIVHGKKMGVPFASRIEHISHFFFESLVQYLRSYELDLARNMGMPDFKKLQDQNIVQKFEAKQTELSKAQN